MDLIVLAVVLALCVLASSSECTKEEYRAKFGVEPLYSIDGKGIGPAVEDNYFIGEVSYMSKCSSGGSPFLANFHEKDDGRIVLFISRGEPQCTEELPEAKKWEGTIAVPLDTAKLEPFMEQSDPLLAFPPDGDYEVYLMKRREATAAGKAASAALMNSFKDTVRLLQRSCNTASGNPKLCAK